MTRLVMACGLLIAGSATAQDKKVPKELEPFQGTWKVMKAEFGGKPVPEKEFAEMRVTITGGNVVAKTKPDSKPDNASISVNAKKEPTEIDMMTEGGTKTPGIYKFEKDGKLTLCFVKGGDTRPKTFTTKDAPETTLLVLEKVKE